MELVNTRRDILRALRFTHGQSQEQCAAHVIASRLSVIRWETQPGKLPTSAFKRILRAYKVKQVDADRLTSALIRSNPEFKTRESKTDPEQHGGKVYALSWVYGKDLVSHGFDEAGEAAFHTEWTPMEMRVNTKDGMLADYQAEVLIEWINRNIRPPFVLTPKPQTAGEDLI